MGRIFGRSFTLVLSTAVLAFLIPSGAVAADPYNTSAQQTLVNQDRSLNGGLAPLAWDTCLAGIAQQNADRIAAQGYLSHTNGPTLDLACLPGATYAGENIAYTSAGINDPQANDMFMNSAPHRANILGNFNYVATAWTVASNGYGYVAEEFLNAPGSPVPPPVPVPDPFKAMFTLDGWGGIHADGGTIKMTSTGYWPNWKIARAVALLPDASGGYVLDGYGGVHQFGATHQVPTAYYGWDIARDVVFLPTATGANPQGYTLDGWGGIHPFGGAPATRGGGYWPNFDIAKRFVLLSDGTGGYILDGWGGLHGFAVGSNPMPPAISNFGYWPNWNIARDIALTPGSTAGNVSGVTLDGFGGLHPFGSVGAVHGAAYWNGWDIARSVRLSPQSTAAQPQGWVLDGYGGLHPFGGAPAVATGLYVGQDLGVQLAEQ
jgi:hypothetical protein